MLLAMEQWTIEHRMFASDACVKNAESVTAAQRLFRVHFNLGRHDIIPSRNTILRWVNSLRITGMTVKKKPPTVLSDPLRRAVLDQYGEEGLKRGVPMVNDYIPAYHYHGDAMLTYKNFFGTSSPYADLLDVLKHPPLLYKMSDGNKAVRKKQPPIRHPLALTLHEIYFGGVKKMKIHRLVFVNQEQSRTEVKEKILSVPIKPGIRPNTEIVFPEEGDQNPAHIPADIIFITEDRPHEVFTREGDDLVMIADITLEEALLGTTVTVKTIDHRTIRVPLTDVVSPAYEKVVEGEGMPILEQYPDKGNLIIRFNIEFPSYLPKSSKEMLKKGFHLAKIGGTCNQHEVINKLVLADKILRVDPDERLPPFDY